jgi:hypothetical protein
MKNFIVALNILVRVTNGGDITVDNSNIDWTGLKIPPGLKPGDYFDIKTSDAFIELHYETAVTYGGTSFKVISPTQVEVQDQKYHYNPVENSSVKDIIRNFMNWFGKPTQQGTDFNIHYSNPIINL